MIILPKKFAIENNKDENSPSVIISLQENILEAEKTLEADWAANVSESQVDYTSSPPAAGDVELEKAASWAALTSSLNVRAGHSAIEFGGDIYYFGGLDGTPTRHNSIQLYSISGDSWSYGLTSGATARNDHAAIEYNGKMYIFGGYNGSSSLNDLWEYDISGDSWTQLTSGASSRMWHSAIEHGGKMYVFGGFLWNSTYLDDLWEYDISGDLWTQLTPGPSLRRLHASAIYNGKMYIFGGYKGPSYRNDLWEYDIDGDSWTQLTSGASVRQGASMVAHGGKLFIFGGYNGSNWLNDLWEYEIGPDLWNQLTTGASIREEHTAINYLGKMIVYGGLHTASTVISTTYDFDMGFLSSGNITTDNIDIGEVPTVVGEWVLGDIKPDGTALTYTAEYSTTGAWGGEEVPIGAIVDGQAITDFIRFWRVTAYFSANPNRDKTPTLQTIKADFSTFITYSDNTDLGYEVAIMKISSLSTVIDTFKPSSIGQMSLTLDLIPSVSDWLNTKYPKNKDVIIYAGYRASDWSKIDYIEFFRGQIDGWSVSINNEVNLNIKTFAKEWSVDIPEKWESVADDITYTAEHPCDVMLNILQNQINVRDSKIDIDSFNTVKAALSGWKVTRTITDGSEDTKKLMEELRVLVSGFFIPRADGSMSLKRFDATETEIETLTDNDFISITWDANAAGIINRTVIYLGWDGDGEKPSDFGALDISIDATSQDDHSEIKTKEIKDKWTASAEKTTQVTNGLATDIISRFKDPPAIINATLDRKKLYLEPGDIVKITTSHAPSSDMGGIADVKFQIINKNLDFLKDKVSLKLLEV